jgi:hypothetical protein
MLWDLPPERRDKMVREILEDPVSAFRRDESLFIKALNTLKWYDLIHLVESRQLVEMLSDSTLSRLFPLKRRQYYANARRLLLKYDLSLSE